MPTPAEIAEQVNFERGAIASGLKKLRDQTKKLEDQTYASATVYGNASQQDAMVKPYKTGLNTK